MSRFPIPFVAPLTWSFYCYNEAEGWNVILNKIMARQGWNIRIFNGCKVRIENSVMIHEGNRLASRGLQSNAEQLSRVVEFSVHTD